jgi:hypothetical protein
MASQPPRCPVASISQSITPVQAGSVSITVNRSGSSQKEMTKDGVGGKAFRAKRMCPSFGRVWLAFGGSSFGYGSVMLRRVLVPLSVAVLAMSACGGEPSKTVVGQICIQNNEYFAARPKTVNYLHLIWSDGTFTLASIPRLEVGDYRDPVFDQSFQWLPAMFPVPCE